MLSWQLRPCSQSPAVRAEAQLTGAPFLGHFPSVPPSRQMSGPPVCLLWSRSVQMGGWATALSAWWQLLARAPSGAKAAPCCSHCSASTGAPESQVGRPSGKWYLSWHSQCFETLITEKWCNTMIFSQQVEQDIYLLFLQKSPLLLTLPCCCTEN